MSVYRRVDFKKKKQTYGTSLNEIQEIFGGISSIVTKSEGSAACCSKVTKETRLVERKCFILEEGNLGVGEGKSKADPLLPLTPTNNQWARALVDGGMGLHAETAVSSDSHVVV